MCFGNTHLKIRLFYWILFLFSRFLCPSQLSNHLLQDWSWLIQQIETLKKDEKIEFNWILSEIASNNRHTGSLWRLWVAILTFNSGTCQTISKSCKLVLVAIENYTLPFHRIECSPYLTGFCVNSQAMPLKIAKWFTI